MTQDKLNSEGPYSVIPVNQDEKSEQDIELDREREGFLEQLERVLEIPFLVLSFLWLIIFVLELVQGLTPILTNIGYFIWALFIVEFILKISIAPHKLRYVKNNIITTIALLLPALRVFRLARMSMILRATRVARGTQLLGIVGSANRGMRALRKTMSRRGLGYLVMLTFIVTFLGSAGMYAFESHAFESYFAALWWTAMVMTTMGTGYWPETPEGRVLCFILALYGFAVFGYVTASIASFFVGRDAEEEEGELAGKASMAKLIEEVRLLREDLATRSADSDRD